MNLIMLMISSLTDNKSTVTTLMCTFSTFINDSNHFSQFLDHPCLSSYTFTLNLLFTKTYLKFIGHTDLYRVFLQNQCRLTSKFV